MQTIKDRDEKLDRVEEILFLPNYFDNKTIYRIYFYHFSMEHPPSFGNVNVKNFPRTNNNRHLLDNHRCNVSASKENLPLSSDPRWLNLYTVDGDVGDARRLAPRLASLEKRNSALKIERKRNISIFYTKYTI